MASFLLPPLERFALPGTADAARLGCTCRGTLGTGMIGLDVPIGKVGQRPRFGAPKAFWYFYSLNCPLHGAAANDWIKQQPQDDETESVS